MDELLAPQLRPRLSDTQLTPLLRAGCPPQLLRETLWRLGLVPPRVSLADLAAQALLRAPMSGPR